MLFDYDVRIIGLENCSILVFGTYPYLLSSRFVSCGWVNILLFLFSPFLIVCSLSQEGGFTHLLSSTAQRTRSVSNPQNGVREKERERERECASAFWERINGSRS